MQPTAQTKPASDSGGIHATETPLLGGQKMRAIRHNAYGGPEQLSLCEIDVPLIGDDQVLVRVHAAGLHRGDILLLRGSPLPARFGSGLFKPNYGVPGLDFSGRVVAVGKRAAAFESGDEVYGECNGSCAEYAIVDPSKIAPKPTSLSFEQAAAIPTSALAALHALRDTADVQSGQKVLINGASGGVGHYALQIAKSLGAEVTGVCSSANVDMVRSLGADHVIDYAQEDFTVGEVKYDVILDNIENHELSSVRGVLAPKGMAILNSGTGASGLPLYLRLFKPFFVSPFVNQKLVRYLSMPSTADLIYLSELVETGRLRPVIERTYPLDEVPAALGQLEDGHVRGKLVVSI